MRAPLVHTLSGRIVLGFTILTLAFGTVSALIVFNMERLSREIRVIRTGYLPLALAAKDLDEKQNILWSYIISELATESSAGRASPTIIRHKDARRQALRQMESVLSAMTAIPPGHQREIARTASTLAEIGAEIERNTPRYRQIQAFPPLTSWTDRSDLSPDEHTQYRKSQDALADLKVSESELRARLTDLASQQRRRADSTALLLERNESRVRLFAILMDLLAVLVGLLVTIWATVTLRPLQRLRDAARRIAAGEYESRISEKGPAEVADLAREFNVMGRAIEERERELVRQERLVAVGKMAAMITHEIRNPLSAIGLNTELLEEEIGELARMLDRDATEGPSDRAAEARNLCQAITAEVDRLTAITEEYLQFARLPKPKLQVEEVSEIARSLAEFQREPLAQRGVELVCDLPGGLPAVRVDHGQLRQALLNLLRNAAEVMAEQGGGKVMLASRLVHDRDGDHVELSVTDTGPGIPAEIMARLFDPFVSTKEGGTGLGLALTHQIIREHGGDLRVESTPGQGATFVISLPA